VFMRPLGRSRFRHASAIRCEKIAGISSRIEHPAPGLCLALDYNHRGPTS
jgi:hypothetical protein